MSIDDVSVAEIRGLARERVRGAVLGPDDPGYEAARVVFLGSVDARPALIVRPADAADVAQVVRLARESGLELAVRGGGHSGAGHSTVEGGIVLDLRDLNGLDLDVPGRMAWAGAGLTAGEFTAAVGAHGLATGFGDTGSVGIGGLTLGGGVGYLARAHGLTIDNLLAAEIVTADGSVLHVDAATHPDLFWAIRGGGGNFGVATRFQFRLRDLAQVVAGLLLLPATPQTVAGFVTAAQHAPDELTTIANVMPCPPMPVVPAEHHGELVIMALVCYAGDAAAAEAVLAPILALATPLVNLVHAGSYAELYPPDNPDYHPTAVSRTMFVQSVDEAAATTILDHLSASDASVRVAQLRALGGAVARVPADATAYAHRACPVMVNVASFYDGPDDAPVRLAWVEGLVRALDDGTPGAYVNFLADEGPARVRQAYPERTWERLAAVKASYDPTNVFRRNQNIAPAQS